MKIATQTADELELQEGSATGMIVGGGFIVFAIIVGALLHDRGMLAILIAAAMLIIGVALILFASAITVNVNRKTGNILYTKKRMVGTKVTTHAIANVFRVETRKQWRMESTGSSNDDEPQRERPVIVAQSMIIFKDGSELAIDHQKTASTVSVGNMTAMSGMSKESAMAAQVAEFLNVPFLEALPPNMTGGINIIGG